MKVDGHDIIMLRRGQLGSGPLKNLGKGDEVQARVIDRQPGGMATLALGSSTITARFTAGVPSANSLVLRLIDDRQGALVFRLVDTAGRERLLAAVAQVAPFGRADLASLNVYELVRSLTRIPARIFELGLLLNDLKGGGAGTFARPLTPLFNRLLKAGMSFSVLNDLAMLFAGESSLMPVLALLSGDGGGRRQWQGPGGETEALDAVERVVDTLQTLGDESLRSDAISIIMDYLTKTGGKTAAAMYEYPWFNGETFVPMRLLTSGSSLLLGTEWTALGIVDFLFQRENDLLTLQIFCDAAESAVFFSEETPSLMRALASEPLRVTVTVHHNDVIFKKMIEIISSFNLNSAIDLKV